MRSTALLLLSLLFFSCEKKETTPPADAGKEQRFTDVSYGPHARNKMNVFLPANRTTATPFVIFMHGGGWVAGDKKDMQGFQELMLTKGIGSVSLNYRYADAATHYTQLMEDVHKAVSFCAAQAQHWAIRPSEYVISGASAGAHMALLYGFKYDTDKRISAIISLAGPTDFTQMDMLNYGASIGLSNAFLFMTGDPYNPGQPLPASYTAASPAKHVSPIPTLIVHGTTDNVVLYSQAEVLDKKMTDLGYTHKLLTITGEGHDLGFAKPATLNLIATEVLKWIDLYGK